MTDDLTPLVDDWPMPMFKIDDHDFVVWANQAAQEWLGKSLRKFKGQNVF